MERQLDRESKTDFLEFVRKVLPHSYSQRFQDLWFLWETGFAQNGYFIEFGALTGRDMSNSYVLELLGWDGVIAEPHPNYLRWMNEYRNCTISTKCVYHCSGDEVVFHAVKGRPALSSIGHLMVEDDKVEWRDNYEEFKIETISLVDLLDDAKSPPVIDCLSIDTEGSEFTILDAYDFDAHKINCICVEHNSTEDREKIYDLLTAKGYRRKWEELSGHDDWYVLADAYPDWNGENHQNTIDRLQQIEPFKIAFEERERLFSRLTTNKQKALGKHAEKHNMRRCIILQLEAVHEDSIPTMVLCLNALGFRPRIMLNDRCGANKGDIFEFTDDLIMDVEYTSYEGVRAWKDAQQSIIDDKEAEFVAFSTFQRDGVAKWISEVDIPVIGLVHNAKVFLAQKECIKLVNERKAFLFTLEAHVSSYLRLNGLDSLQPSGIGVFTPAYFGNQAVDPAGLTNFLGERLVTITGGVQYSNRDFPMLLTALKDEGVRKRIGNLRFVITGGGADRQRLEDEVRDNNLTDHFIFAKRGETGWVMYDEYFNYLRRSAFQATLLPNTSIDYRSYKVSSALYTTFGFALPPITDSWTQMMYRTSGIAYENQSEFADALIRASEMSIGEIMDMHQSVYNERLDRLKSSLEEWQRALVAIDIKDIDRKNSSG